MRNARGAIAFAIACSWPFVASAQLSYREIAREGEEGIAEIDFRVPPALSNDGLVVFSGSAGEDPATTARIFHGTGEEVTSIDVTAAGLSDVRSVQVDDAGRIAFVASRPSASGTLRGVHRTSIAGAPIETLYEGVEFGEFGVDPTPVAGNVALSPNGTLAFSAIISGQGAIYRGPITGPLEVLRSGTGQFYNTLRIDVNDAGTVAVQMEYFDPTAGLARGILLFDEPEQELVDIDTAIERLSVGVQPQPSINASRRVAFALNTPVTLLFFDPPGDPTGTIVTEIDLLPGVYVANPTPWSAPSDLTLYAAQTDGYASFGRVEIDDRGLVVFEAQLAAGGEGIFRGRNPVSSAIVRTGQVIDGHTVASARLGELNDRGQVSLLTSDALDGTRVYRVDGLHREEPPPPPKDPKAKLVAFVLQFLKKLLALIFRA